MSEFLHFSLGPVQGFIAESRRTRDLWVGSYLLSYLAGRAMAAVHASGADCRIVLPAVAPETLRLYDGAPHGDLPVHATLPNRFMAWVSDAEAAGRAAERAIRESWARIAAAVWSRFVAPVAPHGCHTRVIWERQVMDFWEVVWVAGAGDPALLDRRKHWRTQQPPGEPGDHCTMMGRYQELSGYFRRTQRERQEEFWTRLRGEVSELNLRADERLCAIALIKRLLPMVSRTALGKDLAGHAVRWPSTLYVAAWPWMKDVCRRNPEAAARYAGAAMAARDGDSACGERQAGTALARAHPDSGRFAWLDGNFMFARSLINDRATPLDRDERRQPLVDMLAALQKRMGSKASPFYALLLMDGDRMGELLRRAQRTELVTRGLTAFAEAVPGIVEQHEGATVYAGGDDVLAFLPVDAALPAALALEQAYGGCFRQAGLEHELLGAATLSGAIVYAHYHLPLRRLLHQVHALLDEVAKDAAGRASVALAVHRSSGETARWAAPWSYLRVAGGTRFDPVIACIRGGRLGKSVLYRLRESLGRMAARDQRGPGRWLSLVPLAPGDDESEEHDMLCDLIAAELLNDRERQDMDTAEAERVARDLVALCRRVRRVEAGHAVQPGSLAFDGVVLAHFLASGGEEREA